MESSSRGIGAMARITAEVQALRARVQAQEAQREGVRRTLRAHADRLDGAASLVDLEAASLMKADQSQLQASIGRSAGRHEALIDSKAATEDLEMRVGAENAGRRRAVKKLEMEIAHLSRRFAGAVEENCMRFTTNIRHDLDMRATKKEVSIDLASITKRLENLEFRGGGSSSSNARRRRLEREREQKVQQLRAKAAAGAAAAEVSDKTDAGDKDRDESDDINLNELRFSDSDDDTASGPDEHKDEQNGAAKVQRLRDLANQRHDMFLTLQEQVLGVIAKQRATDAKVEKLVEEQRAMAAWRTEQVEPEIRSLKAGLRQLSSELVLSQDTEPETTPQQATITNMTKRLEFLAREVAVLKERLRDRTRTLVGTIDGVGDEMRRGVQSLHGDIASCKTSIVDLEAFSGDLMEQTAAAAAELSDLWQLANKTSVDLQAVERRSAKAALAGTTFLTQMSKPAPRPPSSERVARWRQKSIMMQPSAHARQRRSAQMERQTRPKSAAAVRLNRRRTMTQQHRPSSRQGGQGNINIGPRARPLATWGGEGWPAPNGADQRLE